MAVPLLATKLFLPSARVVRVARPRLLARLDDALQPGRKVALLCAPAGFGKTSLLAEWAGPATAPRLAPPRALAWLSLDASDNNPTRFWIYVLAALDAVRPGIGETLPGALASPQPPPLDVVLTTLINALATDPADAAPLALVLDDYHLITAPAIHEQLEFLVERLPPSLRLVLASRADPPLPLARWRARNELVELRAADLRFSVEEAGALLTEVMGLELGSAEIAALEARTEGWVAGLHLAGLAMRDRTDLPDFVATFAGSHRFALDFLAEEVFRRQPPALRAFLLRTSILERMCGPLCDAVARGGPPSDAEPAAGQDTLDRLERANLFTVRLDDERRWYRYHQLFHAVLRERLRVELSADEIAALHRRASAWLAENQLVPEAIEHALAAADYPRAADLIEQDGHGMIARGQRSQVLAWLDALPPELRRERPRLGHLHAVILIQTNQTAAGQALLDEVERRLDSDDEPRTLRGQVLLSRAVLAWYTGDRATGIRCAEEALEHLAETGGPTATLAAIYAASAPGLTGDVTAPSERRMREAVALGRDLARSLGQVSPHAVSLIALGRMHVLQGRLREAAACFEQARDLLSSPVDEWTGHGALADVAQGELQWEQNDLAEAERLVRRGLAVMEGPTTAGAGNLLAGALVLASLLQARGDGRGALTSLDAFDEIVRRRAFYPGLLAQSAAARARLLLARGQIDAAARWAESAGLGVDDDVPFAREGEYLTLARVLIAREQVEPAIRLLRRRLEAAEADERWGGAIGIRVLLTLAHAAVGDRPAALAHLERALGRAAPEGYVRTFVDGGPAMPGLLQEVRERGSFPEYVDRLLDAFATEPAAPAARGGTAAPAGARPAASLAEPISEREIEVLRLIAAGYSNQEIADALIIALGTVKKHVNNLFGKLAVSSRTQAIVRARHLGLL